MNEQGNHMSRQEQAIQDFMHNCLVMRKEEQIIDNILTELGKHYDADCVSVFEVNEANTHISNRFQWCGEGIASTLDKQQNLRLDGLAQWLSWLAEQGTFFLSAADSELDSEARQMLDFHGAACLMATPILVGERIAGFLCVDTPRQNTGDYLLLSVAAAVCYREASSRRREDAKLEKSEKEMTDKVNQELANQQKLHEANENLTTLLAEEKQYTAIIGALSNVYFGLFYIDLERNTFQELFSEDRFHHTLGEKGDAREALKHLATELVADVYQPVMLQFTDFDTIDARLGDKASIAQEYAARTGGWVQCAFIPVEREKSGKNRTVMCTLRQITAEKEVESQGNLIQALAIPYANIYTVNADTREAICYRMGQAIHERYGQQFAIGNYEQNIQTYIANDVLEEDRNLFDQVRTVDGVNELLADSKAYYFNYRVSREGQIGFYQCQLVKPEPTKNEFVIGFKDVNAEKNIELAAQRKVEEALAAVEQVNKVLQEESAISTALSQEYSSLFKIDARTRKMTLYRTDGIAFDPVVLEKLLALGDYEVILSKYIDVFIVPEDQDRIRESVTLPVLMEKVPEVGLYKLGYRRIKDGLISYFEMNLVKTVDSSGAVTFILGLRNVDEEARRQLKQTRQMEMQREIIEGLGSEYYSVLTLERSIYSSSYSHHDRVLRSTYVKTGLL